MKIPLPDSFELIISNNQIKKITNLPSGEEIETFPHPLTSEEQYKIYIVKNKEQVLYIGTTQSSIRNRLRSGLSAKGQNGYHGYKWKGLPSVKLFVWCFEELNQPQIENIEAELAFIVRKETGKWPDCQNEIHFNNCYGQTGKSIAEEIYKQLLTVN
jgi:hypothetical protein